jgi:hypothetical protein
MGGGLRLYIAMYVSMKTYSTARKSIVSGPPSVRATAPTSLLFPRSWCGTKKERIGHRAAKHTMNENARTRGGFGARRRDKKKAPSTFTKCSEVGATPFHSKARYCVRTVL